MTFVSRLHILPLLSTLLLSFAAHAEADDPAAAMRKYLHVDSHKNIGYFDEKRKPITSEQFDQKVRAGAQVSMEKKIIGDKVEANMYLQAKGAPVAKVRYKVKPGDDFPAFSLKSLDNKTIDNKALKGRYSVISFYFSECAPCIDEVPELNSLAQARTDLNYIGMTFDQPAVTRKFVADHKLGWTLLSDAQGLMDKAGVKSFPTLALLDPQGKVVAIGSGDTIKSSDKTVAAWVARLAPPVTR